MAFQKDYFKALAHPATNGFVKGMTVAVISIILVLILFLSINGKHNKITKEGIEVNIPPSDSSKDDHSTHIDVKGDYIGRDKIIIDTNK